MKDTDQIWAILESVTDPEIPVLSVTDMGIIREVHAEVGEELEVVITPTYSGCPAMNTIEVNIKAALQDAGYDRVRVRTVLSPAWTTDWLTEAGRSKLKAYGIAPPQAAVADKNALFGKERVVPCPLCDSENTELLSQFGSTACKALYRCKDCLEPFDYFKCH